MPFEVVSIAGYASDRTPEAMANVERLGSDLAKDLSHSHRHFGEVGQALTLPWDEALIRAKPLLDLEQSLYHELMGDGKTPILVTGRCAAAIATIPVVLHHHPDAIVFWLDAHGDLNTPETSDSGYLGGMPLAAVLDLWQSGYGGGLTPDRTVHIGARNLDTAEQFLLERGDITALRFKDVELDLAALRQKIKGQKTYIHLDTDVFDPTEVVAEYAEPDGLTASTVRKIFETIVSETTLLGLEIAEVSPRTRQEQETSHRTLADALSPLRSG